ncbi:hypothetical protein F4775DRAFT_587370 [Biscogniauxia sp. FL1348]|nr:hypothetical protein F4775DRAFT_587370 [Biscogniauxia sp. FL1348]
MEPEISEDIPFLTHNDDDAARSPRKAFSKQYRGLNTNFVSLSLGLMLIVSNVFWLIIYYGVSTGDACIRPKLIYTPAISSISYERIKLWRSIEPDNVYTGEPRKELDDAWTELIKPMTIKISAQELAQLGEPSIALKDGSGYLAELAVFHELHCVKRIRHHLHLDYYYGNMTADEEARERDHMDHCLEYWREAAICRGDPTLATFQWHEGRPFSKVHSVHECVNWDKLRRWAEDRMVDTSDLSIFSSSTGP